MTDHTAKNIIGRDLINLREALKRTRPLAAKEATDNPSASASELLMRIDTLIYRHADPELDIAKMWAAGDYRPYPTNEVLGLDNVVCACKHHRLYHTSWGNCLVESCGCKEYHE